MSKVVLRKSNRIKRKLKIRETLSGTSSVPRVSVFKSNKYVSAQLIDDTKGHTLASATVAGLDVSKKLTKTDAAKEVGKELAKKALELKISKAVFDRNGYKYHGRVRAIAEGIREGGLTL